MKPLVSIDTYEVVKTGAEYPIIDEDEQFWLDLQQIASARGMNVRKVALNLRDSFRLIGDENEAHQLDIWINKHSIDGLFASTGTMQRFLGKGQIST